MSDECVKAIGTEVARGRTRKGVGNDEEKKDFDPKELIADMKDIQMRAEQGSRSGRTGQGGPPCDPEKEVLADAAIVLTVDGETVFSAKKVEGHVEMSGKQAMWWKVPAVAPHDQDVLVWTVRLKSQTARKPMFPVSFPVRRGNEINPGFLRFAISERPLLIANDPKLR